MLLSVVVSPIATSMVSPSLLNKINTAQGVSLTLKDESYPILELQNSKASASIALHGAHLLQFTPVGQQPVIFTSDSAVYKEGKAIRGGIPICWPYFNTHPTQKNFPSHGIARNRFWELASIQSTADKHTLVFEMPIHSEDLNIIGGPCKLTVTFEITDTLEISLTTINTGTSDLIIGGALHTYFTVGSIANTSISGLDGVSNLDTLTRSSTIQNGAIEIKHEYDRIFIPSREAASIHDTSNKREIIVTKENSCATTIWNPWIEKSSTMADLGNDDYLSFLCIEAINWREDLQTISPGDSHSLVQKISTKVD